jgi:hypothetical protein
LVVDNLDAAQEHVVNNVGVDFGVDGVNTARADKRFAGKVWLDNVELRDEVQLVCSHAIEERLCCDGLSGKAGLPRGGECVYNRGVESVSYKVSQRVGLEGNADLGEDGDEAGLIAGVDVVDERSAGLGEVADDVGRRVLDEIAQGGLALVALDKHLEELLVGCAAAVHDHA